MATAYQKLIVLALFFAPIMSLPFDAFARVAIADADDSKVQEDPILHGLDKKDQEQPPGQESRIERMELNRQVQEDPLLSEIGQRSDGRQPRAVKKPETTREEVIPANDPNVDGLPEEIKSDEPPIVDEIIPPAIVTTDKTDSSDSSVEPAVSTSPKKSATPSAMDKKERKDRKVQEDPLLKIIERREEH